MNPVGPGKYPTRLAEATFQPKLPRPGWVALEIPFLIERSTPIHSLCDSPYPSKGSIFSGFGQAFACAGSGDTVDLSGPCTGRGP